MSISMKSNEPVNIQINTEDSRLCTLTVGEFSNPFKIKVERVGPQNVIEAKVKMWSLENISNFPASGNPLEKYADSLWVMYKTFEYPDDLQNSSILHFSTAEIVAAHPDTLVKTVRVDPMPVANDSYYYFSHSVKWHRPGASDTLLKPLLPGP